MTRYNVNNSTITYIGSDELRVKMSHSKLMVDVTFETFNKYVINSRESFFNRQESDNVWLLPNGTDENGNEELFYDIPSVKFYLTDSDGSVIRDRVTFENFIDYHYSLVNLTNFVNNYMIWLNNKVKGDNNVQ